MASVKNTKEKEIVRCYCCHEYIEPIPNSHGYSDDDDAVLRCTIVSIKFHNICLPSDSDTSL